MSTFVDKEITCVDCKQTFVFAAGEQQFYREKGLNNDPKRCSDCRRQNKIERGKKKPDVEVTCEACGQQTTVPFKPRGDKPVYCRKCFDERNK